MFRPTTGDIEIFDQKASILHSSVKVTFHEAFQYLNGHFLKSPFHTLGKMEFRTKFNAHWQEVMNKVLWNIAESDDGPCLLSKI